jgi:cob(I)alamin adenosyltransferase
MYIKKWTGDNGETSLRSGSRASKDSKRICAIGAIDELNSFVGLARAESGYQDIKLMLEEIQNDLMEIGADLASPMYEKTGRLGSKKIEDLEASILTIDKELDEITSFILPAGTRAASLLHVCRTVCRRAEREIISMRKEEVVNEQILKYFNRLCEIFFQLARLENKRSGKQETEWKHEQ